MPVLPDGSYPQVGVKSFGAGLFAKPSISGTATAYKSFNRLYDGALILSQVKGWEGAVAVCPNNLSGWVASPEYRTFQCLKDQLLPAYLAPLVRTEWFWKRLSYMTRGVGARRERIRPEQFLEIELPMPEIEKQRKGQRFFAEIEMMTPSKTKAIVELDALLPSILDKAFKGEL